MRPDFWPTKQQVKACEDPIIDEVAIDRAIAGDASVLDAMTAREREALLYRLAQMYLDGKVTKQWVARPGATNGGTWVLEPLNTLADAWGVDAEKLVHRVFYRATQLQKKAAA